ncbi:MAG: TlpA disulfide reductase family protein, partial [Dehalococcoidia bacterium]|nr:TlpA disulfide reductase family protein [Dehalococcoidia bacterium]
AAAAAAALIVALVGMPGSPAWGERIKLNDGTELSASVVDRDAESLVVRVPRAAIATVDDRPLPPPVEVGAVAPAFTATDLTGVARSVGQAQGQATLLQFWASWCPYCRKDVELMKMLLTRYGDRGLRIVTVSIDEDLNKLKAFVAEHALPYSVISVSALPDLPAKYEARGVPGYYLIDGQGVIAGVWRGSVTQGLPEGTPTELEERLEVLMPQKGA